jgi:hypothetical protein
MPHGVSEEDLALSHFEDPLGEGAVLTALQEFHKVTKIYEEMLDPATWEAEREEYISSEMLLQIWKVS